MASHDDQRVKLGDREIEIGETTRRRIIQLAGAAGVTSLAGCGGDDGSTATDTPTEGVGGGDTTETTDAGTVTMDEDGNVTLVSSVPWDYTVNDMDLNRGFGPSPSPQGEWFVFFSPITSYAPLEAEWKLELGREFPYTEGCTMFVPLKQGEYYWWDGTEVTAEDRVYWHQSAALLNRGSLDAVPWEARFGPDKYTFKETKVGNVNEDFRKQNMNRAPDGKRTVWQPIWERARDASSDEERNRIVDDAANLKLGIEATQPSTPDGEPQGYGYGLWRPVDWTANSITFEQHEQHPRAGRSDLDRWQWQVISNQQTLFQAIEQGELDTTTQDVGATDQISNPGFLEEAYSYPTFNDLEMQFSWRNKHLARKEVRRAISFLLDTEQLAGLIQGAGATATTYPTDTVPDVVTENIFSQEFLNGLIQYGSMSKPEEARSELQRAGYSKEGNRWVDGEGDAIEGLSFIATSNATQALIANTISSSLDEFGIGTEVLTMGGTTFQNRFNTEFDFDIALLSSSRRSNGLDSQVNDIFETEKRTAAPEECDPGVPVIEYTTDNELSKKIKVPYQPEWPAYPGLDNLGMRELPSGGGEVINPEQLQLNLRVSFSEDQLNEFARELAWWNNFHETRRVLFAFETSQFMNTRDFSFRDDASVRGVGPGFNSVRMGDVVVNR